MTDKEYRELLAELARREAAFKRMGSVQTYRVRPDYITDNTDIYHIYQVYLFIKTLF